MSIKPNLKKLRRIWFSLRRKLIRERSSSLLTRPKNLSRLRSKWDKMLKMNRKKVNFKHLKLSWVCFRPNLVSNSRLNKLPSNLLKQIWIHSRHQPTDIWTTMLTRCQLEQHRAWLHHITELHSTRSIQTHPLQSFKLRILHRWKLSSHRVQSQIIPD